MIVRQKPNRVWVAVCAMSSMMLAAPQAAYPQSGEQRPDFATVYLAQKEAEFQRDEGNLTASGRLQARNGLLNVIRAQNPLRRDQIWGEGAQQRQVEEALLQTLANHLASVGFLPDDVQALRRAGVNIIEAGSNVLFGRASSADKAAIAEAVVLARVDARSDEAVANDGLGSTLTVTIEKSYKGPYEPGQTVRIRQYSTATTSLEGEIGNETGARYVLFLSPTLYQTRTGSRGSPNDTSGFAVNQLAPYGVQDGVLKATIFGQTGHDKPLPTFESEVSSVFPRN